MTFSWSNLNIGGKIIVISTVIAIISIFMPWIDTTLSTSSGWQQLAFVLLGLYVYPVLQAIRNKPISLIWGSASSISAAVSAVAFMEWKTIPFEGVDLCFAGQGTYLFFAASVFLFAGVLKYKPTELTSVETGEAQ
ncbi:MAG: hypothetical protein Q8J85_14625 [Sulfuricurvum sp.]|nr:hypothetical protein [Sulfuricurvum sp.]MDP3023133.1 hypothetical protein [Sulfuricurvum sp.]